MSVYTCERDLCAASDREAQIRADSPCRPVCSTTSDGTERSMGRTVCQMPSPMRGDTPRYSALMPPSL
jgi:hypothetical protein